MSRPLRRSSRSSIDLSDISDISESSIFDRSIAPHVVKEGLRKYRSRLDKRFNSADPRKGQRMSPTYEKISKIVCGGDGDIEARPFLVKLLEEDPWEALHHQDTHPPFFSLLHKFSLHGCPRCVDVLVRAGADLYQLDAEGNRAIDLARYCQSPNHRDVVVTLQEAMIKQKRREARCAAKNAKRAKEEALTPLEEGSEYSEEEQNEDPIEELDDEDEYDEETRGEATAGKHRSVLMLLRQWLRQQIKSIDSVTKGKTNDLGSISKDIDTLADEKDSIASFAQYDGNTDYSDEEQNDVSGQSKISSIDMATEKSFPYSRVTIDTRDTSVKEGRRKRGPRIGPNSRLIDPHETIVSKQRQATQRRVTAEIYRTDFRQGTFSKISLPNVAKTLLQLQETCETLPPQISRHIDEDTVDGNSQFMQEAAVVKGKMTLDEFFKSGQAVHNHSSRNGHSDSTDRGKISTLQLNSTSSNNSEQKLNDASSTFSWGSASAVSRAQLPSPRELEKCARQSKSAARRQQRMQRDSTFRSEKERMRSVAARRRRKVVEQQQKEVAAEIRFREVAAMLNSPPWVAGSDQCHSSHLYIEARNANAVAQQQMADIPRLRTGEALFAKNFVDDCGKERSHRLALPILGSGSHSYRIGRVGNEQQHAPDQRVASLEALKAQRKKNWWKSSH